MDKKAPLLKKATTASLGLEVPEYMIYFVYLTVFIDILAACISTPVMPYYAQSFGAPVEWIGYLYGAWSFSATVFAPMLSGMSDKWGRKFVLVSCLVGAGVANLIQGSALFVNEFAPQLKAGFWVFLFGRAFSGVWASVGASCNVYITDVCPNKSIREPYLERMSIVPIVAILLGPGLGGGLAAAFGNNVPIMFDGAMTLFSAILVATHLVETPAFLRRQEELKEEAAAIADGPSTASSISEPAKIPGLFHVYGFASFLMSFAGQINLSMNALFYQKLHGLTTLYTGFVFMGMAGVMLISQLTLKPLLKSYLGWSAISCVVFGGCMQGIGLLCVGQSGSLVYHLTCGYVAQLGGTIVTSQASSIVATFTDVSNRGKIFGAMQTYQNFGKIVGPVVATHIAMNGFLGIGMPGGFLGDTIAVWEDADDVHPFGLPFVLSGCLYLIAQAFVFVVKSRLDKQENKPKPRLTGYGEDWHDETGGPEDIERMGLFMAKLLQERHYKWVSQQDQVQQFLTDLVPEMDVNNKEAYQQCFELSQQKAQHN
jgi:MFS family permease